MYIYFFHYDLLQDIEYSSLCYTVILCLFIHILGSEQLHCDFSLSCIGEGNGNPLQCPCLENPIVRGAWWGAVHGVTKSWTWLKWLSTAHTFYILLRDSWFSWMKGGLGNSMLGFLFCICHFLAVWLWASSLTTLCVLPHF